MDRASIKALSSDIETALAAVASKHGVTISTGGIRYGSTSGTVKLEIADAVRDGITIDPAAETFARLAAGFGFEVGDFGRTFVSRGTEYRITGLKPSRPRYPVSAERTKDGKGFKFPARMVRAAMGIGA